MHYYTIIILLLLYAIIKILFVIHAHLEKKSIKQKRWHPQALWRELVQIKFSHSETIEKHYLENGETIWLC